MHKNLDIKYKCIEDVYFITADNIEVVFKKGQEYEVYFDNEGNDYLITGEYKCQFSYYNREFREHFELIILGEKED